LVFFRDDSSLTEKLETLDGRGLRPATAEELFSFSIAEPNERLRYNLVGLGTAWKTEYGRRYVATIGSYIEPGVHPDEPDCVLYDHDKKGQPLIIKTLSFHQGIERKRFVGLVRRGYLWTDEVDGTTVIVAATKDE
jgi:hypothetical protein